MLSDVSPLISRLVQGEDLSAAEISRILTTTSKEDTEGFYYVAFAAALMAKGATKDELLGLVDGLQTFAVPIEVSTSPDQIIDVSGSGGDKLKTGNVSTAAALTVAACGVKVAKQSFRAFTSFTGSSDILKEVGASLPSTGKEMSATLAAVGISPIDFTVAYQGMDARLGVIKKLGEIGLTFPTPLHPIALIPSPIEMKFRLYGIFSPKYLRPIADIFQDLGYEHAVVAHGVDGLDEVSTIGETRVAELRNGSVSEYSLSPADLGLEKASVDAILVTSKGEAVASFLNVIDGLDKGPRSDIVAANAGVALYISGAAESMQAGVGLAQEALHAGSVSRKLDELVRFTAADDGVRHLEALRARTRRRKHSS